MITAEFDCIDDEKVLFYFITLNEHHWYGAIFDSNKDVIDILYEPEEEGPISIIEEALTSANIDYTKNINEEIEFGIVHYFIPVKQVQIK